VLESIQALLGKLERDRVAMPDAQRSAVCEAALRFFRAASPELIDAKFPPGATVWADEPAEFIVGISTGAPGLLEFVAVDKSALAVRRLDDQVLYRPRGLK